VNGYGQDPVMMAFNMLAGSGPQALMSNRMPTPRGRDETNKKKKAAAKADADQWFNGKRVMPTAPIPTNKLQLPYGPPNAMGPMYA
jgi:hypothetical protein